MGGHMAALHFVSYAETPCQPAGRLQMGALTKARAETPGPPARRLQILLQMKFVDVVQ